MLQPRAEHSCVLAFCTTVRIGQAAGALDELQLMGPLELALLLEPASPATKSASTRKVARWRLLLSVCPPAPVANMGWR